MRLRLKILFILCIVVTLYIALDFVIHRFIIFPSYIELEKDEARHPAGLFLQLLRLSVDPRRSFKILKGRTNSKLRPPVAYCIPYLDTAIKCHVSCV